VKKHEKNDFLKMKKKRKKWKTAPTRKSENGSHFSKTGGGIDAKMQKTPYNFRQKQQKMTLFQKSKKRVFLEKSEKMK
jgi:hypothetical protein